MVSVWWRWPRSSPLSSLRRPRHSGPWESLSGEALWAQIAEYEEMRRWGEVASALAKYLDEPLAPDRFVEARFRQASVEFEIARHGHDFSAFDEALGGFERDFPAETGWISRLRRMWAECPVFVRDWQEAEDRCLWYLEAFPDAEDAMLVKMRLAHKKFENDGDRDGAISDLEKLLAEERENPKWPQAAAALANFIRQRDGREKSAAFLLRYVPDGATDFQDASLLHLQMANDSFQLERYDQAVAHAAYVVQNDIYMPGAHEAVNTQAWSLWRTGRDFEALTFLEDATTSYPEISQLHQVVQARTSFQLMLRGPEAAVAGLEDLVSQYPDRRGWLLEDAFFIIAQIKVTSEGARTSKLSETPAAARNQAFSRRFENSNTGMFVPLTTSRRR